LVSISAPYVLSASCWFGFGVFVAAETFVVSPQGDDTHSGTWKDPLKTISAAAAKAQPGDTVLVREGVYRERVAPPRGGREGAPIVYRAEPGKRVVVKGSSIWRPDWKSEGEGVYSACPEESLFDDRSDEYVDSHNPLKATLASTPYRREGKKELEWGFEGDARLAFTCGQVFIDGVPLREVPLRSELEAGTWWYDPATERVFLHPGQRDLKKCQVELTARRRIFAPKQRGLGHIVVEGFIFEHCGNQYPTNFWSEPANAQRGAVGVEAGHHWVIRRNVIRYAKTFALDVGRVNNHTREESAYDNLVEENYLLDNGSAGVMSCGSRNLVIRNNVILRNNRLHFLGNKRWEQAGIKCHLFVDGLIEGNYVAHNYDTYGIWLDNEFLNSRITRNVIYDNGRAGIFLEMSDYGYDRLLVDNNVVLNNHENAVYIHDASGATFRNNLLANTQDAPGFGQAVFIRQVSARTKTYHHSFFGNLLIGNARNIEVNYPAARSGPQRFDFNYYDLNPAARTFVVSDKSDVPSPWSEGAFRELIQSNFHGKRLAEAALERTAEASLTFEEWKSFWRQHGESNDSHSRCAEANSVAYNPATHELTIKLTTALPERAQEETARPADFSKLEVGVNYRVIWEGLPLVDRGQLPPPEWSHR
jgi:parallel beta-helix repeat protein